MSKIFSSAFLVCLLLVSIPGSAQTWQEYYYKGDECRKNAAYTEHCLEDFGKALELKTEESSSVDSAYLEILYKIGFTWQQLGRNREAVKVLKICLSENTSFFGDSHSSISDIYGSMVAAYSGLGKYDIAEIYSNKNLLLIKKLYGKASYQYSLSLTSSAFVLWSLGKYKSAEEYFNEAIEISRNDKDGSEITLAFNIMSIAAVFIENGNYNQGRIYLEEAIEIIKEEIGTENLFYALLVGGMGGIEENENDDDRAEEYYLESLMLFNQLVGESSSYSMSAVSSLASLYESQERFDKADSLYSIVEATNYGAKDDRPNSYAQILINRAQLWKKQSINDQKVHSYLEQAIDIKSEIVGNNNKSLNYPKRLLAEFYYSRGNPDQAEVLFKNILDATLEYLDKSFLYLSEAEREKVYDKLDFSIHTYQSFVVDRYEMSPQVAADLFNLQLSHKSFLLNSTNEVKQQILLSGDRYLIDLYDEVQELKQEIGFLINKGDDEEDLIALEEELRFKDRELTESASFYAEDKKKYNWQDVRASLQPGEAAIEVLRVKQYNYQKSKLEDDKLNYVLMIVRPDTKDHPELITLENGKEMEEKHVPAYKNLIRYQRKDSKSYDIFWKPIRKQLKDINKVYLSADGVYHQISLETLLNPGNGKYVFDEIDIVNLTSLKELVEPGNSTRSFNYAILLGNPAFGGDEHLAEQKTDVYQLERGEGIAPLPGTEKEITIIDDILTSNSWRKSVFTEAMATETALKEMRRPKVLHIATHGFFRKDEGESDTNPLFKSGLLLAGAAETLGDDAQMKENAIVGSDDGILTAYEAMNLNLYGTDLVILSACETGLGEIKNGEGVYGLQRALKVAGSKNILMSLWKVNDQSTQELMTSFYQHWLGGLNKREAFKNAQNEVRKKYDHPYYWGAFQLIGL